MHYRFRHFRMVILAVLLAALTVIAPIISAQQDNYCRSNNLPTINFNETLTGTIEPNLPALLCFDAERGSTITVTVEPLSQGLIAALDVGTPFIESNGTFVDLPIISETADSAGSALQGTATIEADGTYLLSVVPLNESRGNFSITLELSGGNVLGASPSTDTSDDETDTGSEQTTGEGTANIVYGETDLCSTSFSTDVAYGDTIEGTATDIQPLFYCLDASEGDIVTIDISISEFPVAYLLVDPFYDLGQNTPRFAEEFAQVPDETLSREVLIPRDGRYVLFVLALVPETEAAFTITLNGFAGNVYTCQNYPIQTLVNNVWGIVDSDGTPIIEISVACSQRLAVAALGGGSVVPFNVTQEDEVFFLYGGRSYNTVELTDETWILERDDEQTFTLEALGGVEACEDETTSALVQGSWFWELDQNQRFFLDFTCAGTIFVDNTQTEPSIGSYEFDGDVLTFDIGGQLVEFQDVVIADAVMTTNFVVGDFEPIPFELPNALYDAPDENGSEEDTSDE